MGDWFHVRQWRNGGIGGQIGQSREVIIDQLVSLDFMLRRATRRAHSAAYGVRCFGL
jgi:hypothetical protein